LGNQIFSLTWHRPAGCLVAVRTPSYKARDENDSAH
jgi:hypothetical protein